MISKVEAGAISPADLTAAVTGEFESPPLGLAWDRWLHPLRRWWATRKIRSLPALRSVLFVCHGNLCRSPYAARAFLERLPADLASRIEVRSMGFVGRDREPPRTVVAVAAGRGVALGNHVSRLIDAASVREADLVVVMEPAQRRAIMRRFGMYAVLVLADLDPEPIRVREVPDPLDRPVPVVEAVFAQVDRCVGRLADLISETMEMTGADR